jgi:uncharacterized protein
LQGSETAFMAHDAGPADGIVFRPLYEVHHQRYSVYWRIRGNSAGASSSNVNNPK